MSELTPPAPAADEPEVSNGSMLFLRGALVAASLIVFGFLAFTVVSLLDGDDGDDDGESVADFLATTTTEAPAADAGDDTADAGSTDDGSADDGATEPDDEPAADPGDLQTELDIEIDRRGIGITGIGVVRTGGIVAVCGSVVGVG